MGRSCCLFFFYLLYCRIVYFAHFSKRAEQITYSQQMTPGFFRGEYQNAEASNRFYSMEVLWMDFNLELAQKRKTIANLKSNRLSHLISFNQIGKIQLTNIHFTPCHINKQRTHTLKYTMKLVMKMVAKHKLSSWMIQFAWIWMAYHLKLSKCFEMPIKCGSSLIFWKLVI